MLLSGPIRRLGSWVPVVVLLLSFALLSCRDSSELSDPKRDTDTTEQRCAAIVTRILAIQAERTRLSDSLNSMIEEAERADQAGEAPDKATEGREARLRRIREWRQGEANLRTEVNLLFKSAESKGCL